MDTVRVTGVPMFEVRTPTFRRPVLLRGELSSLVAQTLCNWRCIVLDDEAGGGMAQCVPSAKHAISCIIFCAERPLQALSSGPLK